ncbi:MAG: molecular chaperone TorD family protein [Anaerolineales bacterium]|nr:molecular chaperone TorD family protein [Anaerolineales bacterium]
MNKDNALRRAQIYGFLAEVFLYPRENWSEDGPVVMEIVRSLGWIGVQPNIPTNSLPELQAAHRRTFGTAGSLCYETEYGLPHEYRQSQEMADIAGFYRAFGFNLGGAVRERPDQVAVELEFMHILALKEAYALEVDIPEHVEICVDAQGTFLQDHLGRWVNLFAKSVAHNAPDSPYAALAQFAANFVVADADKLGIALHQPDLHEVQHTPFDADFSCADCVVAGLGEQGFIRATDVN